MTARIDLYAPATITAYASGASSLDQTAIFLNDPGSGTIALTLTAANANASLSASSLGGATITSHNNTLTITGFASQVNAALASLEIFEQPGAGTDLISLTATEAGELAASTEIAVNIASTIGPAFAAPPASLSLTAWSPDSITGLIIGDPQLQSLIAAGQGAQETLQLTLAVASGILDLPGFSTLSGITAAGLGSAEILLTFTGDELAAVNALLANLIFAGPAGISGLAYGLRNLSGPLGSTITSGNIALNIAGPAGPLTITTFGQETLILGIDHLAAGTTLTISNITSDLGGITGAGALAIQPGADFDMPDNTLNLGGTSTDSGQLEALALNESGTLIIAGTANIGGVFNLGSQGVIDLSGTLITAAEATVPYQEGLSLAAGAILTGNGELVAGNFSQAGRIYGPGTILAPGGATLLIAAAEISGNAQLQVGAGGVLELGPISPLFGVFEPTPLTIDSGTTLKFLAENGAADITGPFADNLDQSGGVIIINSPDVFAGTIVNFAPGDRLIFPGLTGLTLLSITSQSFVVAGVDSEGNTRSYTINAAYAAGSAPFVYTDNEGDSEVGLRAAQIDIFLGPSLAAAGLIQAEAGIAQPIQGLDVLLRSWTTQVLTLTLSVASGILSDGTLPQGATLTLTAANPTALNAELAALAYTGNSGAVMDELQVTATSGWLIGLSAAVPIEIVSASGTVAGFGYAGQVAAFTGPFTGPIQQPGAPGEILITGTADFADALTVSGLAGTALVIDAGGNGLFGAAAAVALAGDITIGDAGGAGTLTILTDEFSVVGNLTLAAAPAVAASIADIAGAASFSGALQIGLAGNAALILPGTLTAAAATIGAHGTLSAIGGTITTTTLADSGLAILTRQASLAAVAASIAGTLSLGGTSRATIQTSLANSGTILIGPGARLAAGTLLQSAGSLAVAGDLILNSLAAAGVIALTGGTITAKQITLSNASLAGSGVIEAATGLATIALAACTIAAGTLELDADIAMDTASAILLGPTAALELAHAVTGGVISFTGAAAELTIDDLAKFTAPVANMLDQDAIDLVGVLPADIQFTAGTLIATDTAGNPLGGFALAIAAGQPAVQITSDGHGGALITLGGDLPCFARGTGILTPTGYRPVESLNPGDLVITLSGAAMPISWIGHRTLDLAFAPASRPIRFAAGALGPGIPARPVRLSPLHAVFLNGILVPASHLANGATIRPSQDAAVTYYHFELERHAIILADGLPAETFLENHNRGHLYIERGTRVGRGAACAPLVTTGPALAAIRRRLHQIALQAGYSLTYDPALRGAAAQTSLLPRITMRRRRRFARFRLPPGATNLTLSAATASPADTNPDSEDRRQLGICLANPPAPITLGAGWLPPAPHDQGTWMTAAANLWLPPHIQTTTLELTAVIQRWRPPGSLTGLVGC